MKYRHTACVAILLMLLCSLASLARYDLEDLERTWTVSGGFDDFEEGMRAVGDDLLGIKTPLGQAVGYASMGARSLTEEDQRLNAQAIINLIEGANSDLYDASIDAGANQRGLWNDFWQLFIKGQEWSRIGDDNLRDERLADIAARDIKLLYLVSNSIQETLLPTASGRDTEHALLLAQTVLMAINDHVQDMLGMWGFQLWVSPGESIQAAIDSAREGAVISIETGVYRESLEIDKDLTLDGWALGDLGDLGLERASSGVTIQPVSSQTGVTVRSDEEIIVTLRELAVTDASHAITVGGAALVSVESVEILNSEVGVTAADSAVVGLSDCYVELNGVAAQAMDSCLLVFLNSSVQHNTSASGAIHATEASQLKVIDSEIRMNDGHGIVLQDQATAGILNSSILLNKGDAISLSGSSEIHMEGTSCTSNDGFGVFALTDECVGDADDSDSSFVGRITGSGNFIPGRGEVAGNLQGGTCPESLQFLTSTSE